MKELESLLAEESSTSSANSTPNDDSTTDDSTTDDSASNERPTVFADRGYSHETQEKKLKNWYIQEYTTGTTFEPNI